MTRNWLVLLGLMLCSPLGLAANTGDEAEEAEVLAPIKVQAQRVANLQPASTYSALATGASFRSAN